MPIKYSRYPISPLVLIMKLLLIVFIPFVDLFAIFDERISDNESFLWAAQANSTEKQMTFYGVPPREPAYIFGSHWDIYASGTIDADAATHFEEFIAINKIPPRSTIYFNSLGGSLLGGINLGRAIRKAGMYTNIGKINSEPNGSVQPGECYSAAALAFLGGKFRFSNNGSLYGVHRFRFDKKKHEDVDVTQILSATIVQYIRDMGVDPKLFNEMTKSSSEEISILSDEELHKLLVFYNGYEVTKWTLETIDELIYLKGEQDTWRGINKFILFYDGTKLHAYIIFSPEGRADEILEMNAISLYANGEHPIAPSLRDSPKIVNGLINFSFTFDADLLMKLQRAKTIGVCFQYVYDAPMFLGFNNMDFVEGAKKLRALMNSPFGK